MSFSLALAERFLDEITVNFTYNQDVSYKIYLCAKEVLETKSLIFIKKTQNNNYQLLRYSEDNTQINIFDEKSLEAFYCESGKRSCFVSEPKFVLNSNVAKAIYKFCPLGYVQINLIADLDGLTDAFFAVEEEICIKENDFKEFALKFAYSIKTLMLETEIEKLKNSVYQEESRKIDTILQHECKIPISAILAANENLRLQLIQNGKIKYNRSYKIFSEAVETNAYKAMRIICNLLDCSALTAKKIKLVLRFVAIKRLVNSFVEQIADNCKALNIELEYNNEEINFDYYFIDEEKVQRIIVNLVSNAIKAVRLAQGANPKIIIRIYEDENYFNISVEDNGLGLDAKALGNVFDKFSGKNDIDSYVQGDTGLGLYISSQLAEIMDGSITVTSTINKGSEFVLHVPKVQFTSQAEGMLSSSISQYSLSFNEYIKMEFAYLQ